MIPRLGALEGLTAKLSQVCAGLPDKREGPRGDGSYTMKENVVSRVLKQRGDHPGLIHIISAMAACDAYQPWHDKHTHKTFVRPDSGKCLHDYFYFMDAELA